MEVSQARPQNMIDTTDALEAVSACQSMKNFLFTLILIGLVLCQAVFWMDHFGLVNKDGCASCQGAVQPKPQASGNFTRFMPMAVALTATTDSVQTTEPVAAKAQEGKAIEQAIDKIVDSANQAPPESGNLLEKETDLIPAEIPADHATPEMLEPQAPQAGAEAASEEIRLNKELFRISCWFAKGFVAICNFFILTAAVLYCLSLLLCLKISLAGRLGGINHITRAFFISLFALVIITPWQVVLPKVLIGATWLPGELLCCNWGKADSSTFWKVMLYLRFCALPFAAVWLLMWTQIRSGKWTRATLRRLGVVR